MKVYAIEFYDDLLRECELHEKAFKHYHIAVNYLVSKGYRVIEINNGISTYKKGKYEFATIHKLEVI